MLESPAKACFVTQITARMGDVDMHDRMYVSRFFEWSHQAFEDLMVAANDRLDKAFDEEGWGMPLVHAEATVHQDAGFPETLKVELRVRKRGNRSLALTFRFLRGEDVHVASTELVHAFAPLDGLGEAIPFPSRLHGVLERMGLLEP
jgi:acyl-CoA thioesterase FadM